MKRRKLLLLYIGNILLSGFAALNYKIFVFPNSFAPSGIDGICTMVQYLTGTNIGYLALAVNIPLLVTGFFTVDKTFIIRSAVYVVAFSSFSVLLGYLDLSDFLYYTDTGTSTVLAPIAAGVIRGILYAATLKLGSSSGGIDVIAAMIRRRAPHYNIMSIIFFMNVLIAVGAYFVYGFKPEPVICSIIYSFVTTAVSKSIGSASKENIRFEVITKDAERLCSEISQRLGISSTVINAEGGYSKSPEKMVICVSDKKDAPELEKILIGFPDAVVFESKISSEKVKKY